MIFHTKRRVFIHIPKTAGTSLERRLGNLEEPERNARDPRTDREIQAPDWKDCASVIVREGPFTLAREMRGVFIFPERPSRNELNEYLKFAFIRSSWVRVYSWYRNVMRDRNHHPTRGVPAQYSLCRFLTEFDWQTELRPQLDWLTDRQGRIAVVYIGNFENLPKDFRIIAQKLRIDIDRLLHLTESSYSNYRTECNTASSELVAMRYAREIDMFGYIFEQDNP